LSDIWKFPAKENKFLKRLKISIELNLGLAYSRLTFETNFENQSSLGNYVGNFDQFNAKNDFHGRLCLKSEYEFAKKERD
jgi:hypothetical protein